MKLVSSVDKEPKLRSPEGEHLTNFTTVAWRGKKIVTEGMPSTLTSSMVPKEPQITNVEAFGYDRHTRMLAEVIRNTNLQT